MVVASPVSAAASPWSVSHNTGTCRVTNPVVKVKLAFRDGGRTSIGYTTSSWPDVWPQGRQSLRNGTYTLRLPKVAPGDSERYRIHILHGSGRSARAYGTAWRTFTVPTGCPNLTYKKLLDPRLRPAPFVTGTTRVGQVLTAFTDGWDPAVQPQHFTFRWERNGFRPIAGATRRTYRLTPADIGKKVRVIVNVRVPGYSPVRRASWYITGIRRGTFSQAPTPVIAGTPSVGQTLTAQPGSWSPQPTLRYAWFRSGKPIKGAHRRTYRLVSADAGDRIRVKVTASRRGYITTQRVSAPTGTVS
jgi:hypothetical protein